MVLVLELGVDPDRGLGDRLDLRVDEGDLAAEPLLLDRQRVAAVAVEPGLELDDLPLLDPVGVLERDVGVGPELVEVAEPDDRLVGPDALAGVLQPLDDDAVERGDDRVLVEGLLGQVELGLGRALRSPRPRWIMASATLSSASALRLLLVRDACP